MKSPEPLPSFVNGQEKIRAEHLKRTAYIYMRQSSAGQVAYHRESQVNQERMAQRAELLGWSGDQVQIIRSDLGQSAREAQQRQGFQEMLSAISLGQVGIIFGYEVSRLSRNNSDWYRLLEAAALFDTLIADYDGIYDLNLFNDRLLLGLKGTMSEAELHLIQLRLVAGRKRQLERGEYRQFLPTGYCRLEDGTVIQDPDERVRQTLQLIFQKFRELPSCGKLLVYLKTEKILLPRRQVSGPQRGQILWKAPAYGALYAILTMPTYAGALVYGRRQSQAGRKSRVRKALEDWKYIHQDVYPAYISWEEFLDNQRRLQANATQAKNLGASREGSALLQGLVYCAKCGRKMVTAYKPCGRYSCETARRSYGEPLCAFLNASLLDQIVIQAFFEVLQPAQLDLLEILLQKEEDERWQLEQQWQNRLRQAEYETQRAQRQYELVEPENRLVTAELERRWESSLRNLQNIQADYESFLQKPRQINLSPELKEQFRHLCQHLPQLWEQIPNLQKKELLRCLISKVIVQRQKPELVEMKIVWLSGHFSQHQFQLPIFQNRDLSDYEQMLERIHTLWQQKLSDPVIAQILTAEGFTTARSDHISPYSVQVIRIQKRWLRSSSPKIESPVGYLKVPELAQRLGVQEAWIYTQIRKGRISASDFVRFPKRKLILFPDETVLFEKILKLKQT
jgi:DNA invertase Pin-like site-specific DNA recombinase/predicted DNA-binding transcriptional regulator AlpA